jgi:hypothetical protein
MKDSQFVAAETRYAAKKACPWALAITKVEGGFMCFASTEAQRKWKRKQ